MSTRNRYGVAVAYVVVDRSTGKTVSPPYRQRVMAHRFAHSCNHVAPGDVCLCGRPIRSHFNRRGRKLDCSEVQP